MCPSGCGRADRASEGRTALRPVHEPGEVAWHAAPADEVLARLGTRGGGLTSAEADRRLAELGPNDLPAPHPVAEGPGVRTVVIPREAPSCPACVAAGAAVGGRTGPQSLLLVARVMTARG